MGPEDFHGRWNVMTSGRSAQLPWGNDTYLCIYTKVPSGGAWALKTQKGDEPPQLLGNRQWGFVHQQGEGIQRICCQVEFPDRTYCFEAVLATQVINDRPAVYGHLYPISAGPFQGEGATGGWSADRQGEPPIEEEG